MEAPSNTLVALELDPGDHVLTLSRDAKDLAAGFSGEIRRRADQHVILRFSADAAPEMPSETSPPWGDLRWTAEALPAADAVFLMSVLLLTEHHQDEYLHRAHPWGFIDAKTQRRFELPHPPRIETAVALLESVPVNTRVRLLVEACELAVPVWTSWARHGDLAYFDGVMAMASVPHRLAEDSIDAARTWLDDGDPVPLQRWRGEYGSLHWPMLEDEWSVPPNVYYALFAPCNLLDCALEGGSLDAALTCIRQATAARATDAQDTFLGEPFRKAFFLAWWRACLRVLCPP